MWKQQGDQRRKDQTGARACTTLKVTGCGLSTEWEVKHMEGDYLSHSYHIMMPWEVSCLCGTLTLFYQQNNVRSVIESNNVCGLSLYEADSSMNDKEI